jgi:hypothetical protein
MPTTKRDALIANRDFSWDAPDESLLEDRRGVLPEFPHGIFPSHLSDWLTRASRGVGTRIDHVAVPLLGVASSLIGKSRRVQASTSWIVPMTLWTSVIGYSGDRKTPGLQVNTRALDTIEEENSPQYRQAHLDHKARVEIAKAELKRWKKACTEAIKATQQPPPMPMEAIDPGDFIWPSLYVTDATIPRLAKLCVVRPRGMLVIRDELAGLFAAIKQQISAREFFLESSDGKKHIVERVDDDRSIIVPNLLVGVIGGFQPDKLASAFAGDEDGLYARFLYGWPLTPPYAPLTDTIAEVDPEFQALLTKLIRLPAEDSNGAFAPRIVPLSAAAREEFEGYRQFVDQTKHGIEGREQQWLAKSETHLLRLAGTLAFLAWADGSTTSSLEGIAAALEPDEIDAHYMADAARLMREYFWPHARAALRQIGLSDRHRHLRRVLRWIRAHGVSEISLKDVRRDALAGSLDAEQTRDAIDRLVTAGWLRPRKAEQTGGRPRERWAVNPRIFAPAETAESDLSAVRAVSATGRRA